MPSASVAALESLLSTKRFAHTLIKPWVVEAPARSGALITANQAMEQGRNVYAVPGPIDRPHSEGCHRLIQDGAKLVLDSRDVLEEMEILFTPAEPASPAPGAGNASPVLETLDETERRVLEVIGDEETPIDALIEASELPSAIVSATLLKLEMKRLVKPLPGKYFTKLI